MPAEVQVLFVWSVLAIFANCAAFQMTPPDFLKPCKINEPGFVKCSTSSIQTLFTQWKDGIPGLESAGKLDPFKVNKVTFSQENQSGNLTVELTNCIIKGFSGVVVKENVVKKKDFSWVTKFFVPKLRLDSDYKVNGRILVLNLNGNGKMFIETDNVDFVVYTKVRLRDEGGFTFSNVTKVDIDMKIGGLRTRFDNLFNGQKAVEDATNQLFNESWQDFFEAMRPAIIETMNAVLLDRFKKVFNFIPTNFFISDIPTAKDFYEN